VGSWSRRRSGVGGVEGKEKLGSQEEATRAEWHQNNTGDLEGVCFVFRPGIGKSLQIEADTISMFCIHKPFLGARRRNCISGENSGGLAWVQAIAVASGLFC